MKTKIISEDTKENFEYSLNTHIESGWIPKYESFKTVSSLNSNNGEFIWRYIIIILKEEYYEDYNDEDEEELA